MNLLFAPWGSATVFNKNSLGSGQEWQCLFAVRKHLPIKKESHGGNPDLSQLAALDNLPFKMFDKIGESMELAKENYRFWVRIASKSGLTCSRTGHRLLLPQSGLHSEAFGYLHAPVCQADQAWWRKSKPSFLPSLLKGCCPLQH